jgi:RNA polymerase sigma factor (sigma-70 family)
MSPMNRIQDAEAIEAPARTSDGELLARFLDRRDDAAFAELVARHGPMVFGVCHRLLGQHADAEDCFQAAFLSLATHGRKLTDRPTVGAWLYTVARQIAVKALRSRRRRRWVFWESLLEPAAATASEATVDLDAALATLNEDERSAVVLCHLEGYTRAAAAKTLGWPEGTLSVRLSRALEKLRKKLGRPPLAVLAGAMVVMLPDQLPAATLASVRHLREGTLDDWAPPRTVELYRKAQPMKILHRAGPVVAALLAAILIMIAGITGW